MALPAPVVPTLRRLLRALDDPAALAGAPRRRRARRARAVPRVADAAPSAADAALVRAPRLRGQPVRARGTAGVGRHLD